ncbi:MAG: hypothetical protein J5I94_07400 [Phaeodactylibacter sp.]|nr:hypothetical protein [Phaeodactylibacter sp.]
MLTYYLFIKPLSLLPLRVSYLLSDLLYFVLYYVLRYRRKVVFTNLRNSFPEKSAEEIEAIARKFYQHFCDLSMEAIHNFSISKEELVARCRLRNPELLEQFYRQGKSIIIASGHYNNWEMAALAFDLQASHQGVGIYKPLRNAFLDGKLRQSRAKYGLELVPKDKTKAFFLENSHRLTAPMLATDQSPSKSINVYWARFLNQDTAVLFGTEKYAREFNYPVVYGHIYKMRRGYYEMVFEIVEDKPSEAPHGAITEKHTKVLEKDIQEAPQYWLWTHKRWKRKRPLEPATASGGQQPTTEP